jgi:hypothetical protein
VGPLLVRPATSRPLPKFSKPPKPYLVQYQASPRVFFAVMSWGGSACRQLLHESIRQAVLTVSRWVFIRPLVSTGMSTFHSLCLCRYGMDITCTKLCSEVVVCRCMATVASAAAVLLFFLTAKATGSARGCGCHLKKIQRCTIPMPGHKNASLE